MNKKIIYLLITFSLISLVGCSSSTTSDPSSPPDKIIQAPNTTVSELTPFALTDTFSYFSPFVFNGTDLIFPNPDENNRISIIPDPLPENILESKNVTDFADYSADNITLIDGIIYFADGSDNNALSSFDTSNKKHTKLNTHSTHNLIALKDQLYYVNKNDNNKIYNYNTSNATTKLISADSAGSFIVNEDYVIYQNLSDNSKLYSIKTDGTGRQKLTDYTANSFVVLNGQLLFFNSSDNNNLYSLDPSTMESKRIYIMNGFQLKLINSSLYFINGDDANNLYSLSVDFNNSTATYVPEITQSINEYFLTPTGIFYSPSINVNNIYLKKFTSNS